MSTPCNMAIGIISFPKYLLIEGSNTSIEFTPAADIGASLPKYLLMSGIPRIAIISRKMLLNKAIVPSSVANCSPMVGSLNWVIKMDERE